jgi:hypothetical protein
VCFPIADDAEVGAASFGLHNSQVLYYSAASRTPLRTGNNLKK